MIDYSKWSANLAYAVGLISTDGNLSIDGRHIELTSKDIEQLENMKKCLEIDTKIAWKTGGFSEKKYPRLQFSDVKFYRWLQSIGLSPRKTHSIGRLLVPSEFFFDFLRGCFDGDGSIDSYWDKRWRSSYMFYVKFYSASEHHLMWMNQMIFEELDIQGRIGNIGTVYRLMFAKKKSLTIINEMYRPNCICLSRKRDKIRQIIATNECRGGEMVYTQP